MREKLTNRTKAYFRTTLICYIVLGVMFYLWNAQDSGLLRQGVVTFGMVCIVYIIHKISESMANTTDEDEKPFPPTS